MNAQINYYCRLVDVTGCNKCAKYAIAEESGYYPPMEQLRGKDGRISMYLLPAKESGVTKANAPAMRLQAAGNLNFTGLHGDIVNGRLRGYAYGYANGAELYGGKNPRRNPFYEYRGDAYLFLVHWPDGAARPSSIEMAVLAGARRFAAAHCNSLKSGNLDFKSLRDKAANEL